MADPNVHFCGPIAALASVTLVMTSVACLEPRAGSRGTDDGHADAAEVSADATAPDTMADVKPDTSAPTDTGADTSPVPDVCDADPTVERLGLVTFDEPEMAIASVPLDGATLFGTRRTAVDGVPDAYRIVALDLVGGTETVVAEDATRLTLLDAREGALLFASIDYATRTGTTTLHYLEVDTGRKVELTMVSGGDTGLVPGPYGLGARVRVVERGAAVWGEQSYAAGGAPIARIRRFAGGAVETLWEERTGVSAPHLRDGRVLWTSQGERAALWLAEPGETARPIARGTLGDFALTADAAWWIEGGAVMRFAFATGESQRVHEGPCALLTSDATRAAAVCGPDVTDAAFFGAVAGQPIVFDHQQRTKLVTRGGDVIAGLRVEGRRVAWVEYPADVGCGADIFGTGELVLASLDAPEAPLKSQVVSSGCWCCGAYWPPLELALSDRAMAWNYPFVEDVDPSVDRGGSVGWALFASPGCP